MKKYVKSQILFSFTFILASIDVMMKAKGIYSNELEAAYFGLFLLCFQILSVYMLYKNRYNKFKFVVSDILALIATLVYLYGSMVETNVNTIEILMYIAICCYILYIIYLLVKLAYTEETSESKIE